jgi:hypothetical protein
MAKLLPTGNGNLPQGRADHERGTSHSARFASKGRHVPQAWAQSRHGAPTVPDNLYRKVWQPPAAPAPGCIPGRKAYCCRTFRCWFQNVMECVRIEVRTHLPTGWDGPRGTVDSENQGYRARLNANSIEVLSFSRIIRSDFSSICLTCDSASKYFLSNSINSGGPAICVVAASCTAILPFGMAVNVPP